MIIYANAADLRSSKVSERLELNGVKNLGMDTKNISVGDFVEKLEHFIGVWL